jgi:hypothetical protein
MMLNDSNYVLKNVSSEVDGLYRNLCWHRSWWGHARAVCYECRSHTSRRTKGGWRLCTWDTPKTTRYFQQHKNILWPTMGHSERWWTLMVATWTSCNDPNRTRLQRRFHDFHDWRLPFTIDDYLWRSLERRGLRVHTHTTCTCRSEEVDKVIQKSVSTLLDVAVTLQRGRLTHAPGKQYSRTPQPRTTTLSSPSTPDKNPRTPSSPTSVHRATELEAKHYI